MPAPMQSGRREVIHDEDFAITGLSFRLPQDISQESTLWEFLEHKINLSSEWPKGRLTVDSFKSHGLYARGAHFFATDPGLFDAPFFSITAKEAATMDPQQRLALEAAYHAFENAGIPVESLRGSRTAVFSATMSDDYLRMTSKDFDTAPKQTATALQPSILPNRLSWYFDLHGPSVHIDTACSGTLTALDMACQTIRSGNADSALVLGSNLLLSPESSVVLAQGNFLSPDSKCFSFDARANGYARGEGVVAIVVKPLDSAVRDGDVVRGVIRGIGSNQDGRTSTLTHPSADAQEALIRQVYFNAGIDFNDTRYFEAHGTGTSVGDPIEMNAIGRVFSTYRSRNDPLYVGSVKSNLGHLEGASGGAGVVKTILALERGTIPPTALFETMNPAIDAELYNVKVPTAPVPWPSPGIRRASVSSFGYGGTNTHVILDDALHYLESRSLSGFHNCVSDPSRALPALASILGGSTNGHTNGNTNGNTNDHDIDETNGHSFNDRRNGCDQDDCRILPKLLVWSAADERAAQRVIQSYQSYYRDNIAGSEEKLSQLAYTLGARRSVHSWRTYSVVGLRDTIAAEPNPDHGLTPVAVARPVRAPTEDSSISFVFTGQGAQYARMGLELLEYHPFKQSLCKSDAIFKKLGSAWSTFDELASGARIHEPQISQPLCTALQIALVQLLAVLGGVPRAVVGHSSGEIAAAYAAGALSQESACKVAYFRGQVAGKVKYEGIHSGTMISVNMSESEGIEYLSKSGLAKDDVCIACVNSPRNITLSGSSGIIDRLENDFDTLEVYSRKLNTGVAYHTAAMSSVAAEYLSLMGNLDKSSATFCTQSIPMVSSVTGNIVAAKRLRDPQYWVDNLVSPVRFADAIERLTSASSEIHLAGTITDLIEVGPHGALRRPVMDSAPASVRYHSVLDRTQSQIHTVLKLVGNLFCYGHPVSILAANRQTIGSLPYLVDCPSYPFDHSKRYWSESRFSKNFRVRPASLGHMLGMPSHDWNDLRPRWRNFLSNETMPWLADHVVSGTTICPGTGTFLMAMESVIQKVNGEGHEISLLTCKEAHFLAPITVGMTAQDATEVMLHLEPIQSTYEKRPSRYEISIFAHREDRWKQCFYTDTLAVQYKTTATTQVDGGQEDRWERARIQEVADRAITSCTKKLDSRGFYGYCKEHGLQYGEAFQLLQDIAWDGDRASIARIDLEAMQERFASAGSPAHPTVLDAAFHLMVAQLSKGLVEHIPTLVPQRFTKAWSTAKPWSQLTTRVLIVAIVEPHSSGLTDPIISCYVMDEENQPLCAFESLHMTAISQPGEDETGAKDQALVYNISWKPQLSTLSPSELLHICDSSAEHVDTSLIEEYYVKSDTMLRLAARRALKTLSPVALNQAPAHIRRYVVALKYHFGMPRDEEEETVSESRFEALLKDVESGFPDYRVFSIIGRALPSILTGDVNPLELMFANNDAGSLYRFLADDQMRDGRFRTFLDLASHEKPGINILEVGAGTGSISRHILGDLKRFEKATGQSRFASYTFTDVSSTFFPAAKEQLGDCQGRLLFQTLDLERQPESQGFRLGAYDMIVAGLVLHATSDIQATLRKLRSLLRPGGHLVIHEVTSVASPCANVTFGVLDGWWKATEEWRQYTPLAAEDRWGELLTANGFSGLDLVLQDHPVEAIHLCSLLVSTAVQRTPTDTATVGKNGGHAADIILLTDSESHAQQVAAGKIEKCCNGTRVLHLADIVDDKWTASSEDLVVSLLDLGVSCLASLSDIQFYAIKRLLQSVQNMLWVSSSAPGQGQSDPYTAPPIGFMRSIRSELPNKRLVTLAIESCSEGTEWDFVSKVLNSCFLHDNSSAEVEFVVRNGHLFTGRLAVDTSVDAERLSRVIPEMRTEPWKTGPPLRLSVGTPGMLDTLTFVEDVAYEDDLSPDEVEIEAFAWPISFRDIFIALGRLGQEEMGFECAGMVRRVGSGYSHDVQPGDRVVMVSPGCMRTYPRASANMVVKIPDHLGYEETVAMLSPSLTAQYCLVNVARLQRGEKVLIHSGAGSTGQMAISLAQRIGAEIYTTVGFDEKKKLLIDRFGVPANHIFYSRDTSFAKGVMRLTGGQGVDVVLNSLSGESLYASWECVAPYGRFVEIGKADIRANTLLPMSSFAKNVTFAGVDMLYICQSDKALGKQLMRQTVDTYSRGELKGPDPLHVFNISDIEKAFRYMQGGANTGRIVVTAGHGDQVPKLLVHRSTWQFDPNATYVVVGGLGGIGRAILLWMAKKGARHLLVLSRSGTESGEAAAQVVTDLRDKCVHIDVPRCNVANADELAEALRYYTSRNPNAPIRGCINSAMVLQDSVLENMTHAQWSLAVQSKVSVSWNLHKLLPRDMSFFISLSSLSGIYGSPGQSNYAAGCVFQDALARHRTMTGHRGSVTFDLGWLSTIGVVAESEDLRRYQKNARIMRQVDKADLFAMFDYYCDPALPPIDVEHCQVLIGVFTQANFHARGESPSPYLSRPLFAPFDAPHFWASVDASYMTKNHAQDSAAALFSHASGLTERSAVVAAAFRAKLARALDIAVENVDPRGTPSDYGADSLMAVELRNWIRNDFGVSLAVFEIMGGDNILSVGKLVAQKAEA